MRPIHWKILRGFAGHCLKNTPKDKCRWLSRTAITCGRIDRAVTRQMCRVTGWVIRLPPPPTNTQQLGKLTCHRLNQPWNDKKHLIHHRKLIRTPRSLSIASPYSHLLHGAQSFLIIWQEIVAEDVCRILYNIKIDSKGSWEWYCFFFFF
jgi:hypothetical protein